MTNCFSIHKTHLTGLAAVMTIFIFGAAADTAGKEEIVEITGTTEFEAPTNMPAVSVKGKSSATQGRVTVSRG